MQRRFVVFGSRVTDLKDCSDMLRIALANVLAKLAILRAFRKNVGNSVMLQIVIEVSGLQIDLSGLSRDSNDVSSRAAGLDLHRGSFVDVPPANRFRRDLRVRSNQADVAHAFAPDNSFTRLESAI